MLDLLLWSSETITNGGGMKSLGIDDATIISFNIFVYKNNWDELKLSAPILHTLCYGLAFLL